MTIRLTAANVAFRQLRRTIELLARVPGRTAALAAPKLTGLLQQQFADGADPYGRPWRPLKASTLATGRTPPPLTGFTGRLKSGTEAAARADHAGIRIRVGAPYGAFHQVGFRVGKTRVPPRRILPAFGLPRSWSIAIRSAAIQAGQEARLGT